MPQKSNNIVEVEQKIAVLQEKQLANKQQLARIDKVEQHFVQTINQGERLFHQLYETWKQDNELKSIMINSQLDVKSNIKNARNKLEKEREILSKDIKKLDQKEHDLYVMRRLYQEENQ